jgi:hypothetical protein
MHKSFIFISAMVTLMPLMNTSAKPLPLPVPERGFVSIKPAKNWEEGLITANGTLAINALSRPLDERIIFNHERLFMPMGKPHVPPDQSAHLPEIRKLIEEGKYKEAEALQFKLSGQKSFMYPDFYVPAFDLTIDSGSQGEVRDYARSVDFQTGEAVVHWSAPDVCLAQGWRGDHQAHRAEIRIDQLQVETRIPRAKRRVQ